MLSISPLEIINEFLIENLYLNCEKAFQLSSYDLRKERIFDESMLMDILNKNLPLNLKKKDCELWGGKIKTLVSEYKSYISYLCDDGSLNINYDDQDELFLRYKRKFHSFREAMLSKRYSNNSVHY
jgi:hypothetical protein